VILFSKDEANLVSALGQRCSFRIYLPWQGKWVSAGRLLGHGSLKRVAAQARSHSKFGRAV